MKLNPKSILNCLENVWTLSCPCMSNTPLLKFSKKKDVIPLSLCTISCFLHPQNEITRELAEICITSRIQKVWVVELVHGPAEIPQWRFLSVPVRAFEQGCTLNYPQKTVWITFSRTSTDLVPNFSLLYNDYGCQVLKYRKWCTSHLRTTYRGRPGDI